MRLVAAALMIFVIAAPECRGGGLETLINVAKQQAEIGKALDNETQVYAGVKKGIETGAIAKGVPGSEIRRQYGDPVVMIAGSAVKAERWVYKPASSTHFKGERVSIYFDKRGLVDHIKFED